MPYRCVWCHSSQASRTFVARERLFGMEGEFEYAECAACGSLQILHPPSDLSRYYPREYDAYNALPDTYYRGWLGVIRSWRDYTVATGRGWLGRLVLLVHPQQDPRVRSLRLLNLAPDTRVLDVGCGSGLLLLIMHRIGFQHAEGIDPYFSSDRPVGGRVPVYRRTLQQHVESQPPPYDVLMYHHVLEHIADPERELRLAQQLLKTGGRVLVRLPLAGSYHWRQYGTDWFQLDAPRHLSIPSVGGMRSLAERSGYTVEYIGFDALPLHLHASELYRRGIPGRQHRPDMHSRAQWREFARLTERLNRTGEADSGVFLLRKGE
ncbi:MAG: class I SAM-dependent methyltransferase [Armatimonadetes bacterium]|nr:class I SAM-dependent methyltransferase [Armatimonadota bacterium]